MTFKYIQEFVLLMFHLYSALTNRQNITTSLIKVIINKVELNSVTL